MELSYFSRIKVILFRNNSYVGYSQSTSKIYIYDKEYGIPVEDANITMKNGGGGTSDRNGMFEFSLPHPDSITVSHISYVTFTTVVGVKNVDTLFLNSRIYEIPQVSVFPNRLKRIGITSQKEKHYGRLYAYGQEIAKKFKLSDSPSRLLDLKFPIIELGGADSVLVKADFFNITKGMPGKKINNHQILFIVNQQNDVSIDLSAYDIVMNDDFILSMQIVKVYANDTASGKPIYISIPVKIMVGEIFTRTLQTGWDKKRGASFSINILTSY